jgi:hypothetical protein
MRTSLSILLLVRHADALGDLAADVLALAARHSSDYELLLVTSGALPATRARADALAATHAPVVALHYPRQRALRATLLDAWRLTRGERLLLLDADRAGAADAARLLAIAEGYDLVIGARPGADPRLLLLPEALRGQLATTGADARLATELETAARALGLTVARAQLAPAGQSRGRSRRAVLGAGALVIAGWLWLIRRRGAGGKR